MPVSVPWVNIWSGVFTPEAGTPDGPMMLKSFGPPGGQSSVLLWRDQTTRMTYSLIPGGTFSPRFREAQIARVAELFRMDSDTGDDEYDAPQIDPSLGLKPSLDVSPFFLAVELVRPNLPGLRAVANLSMESYAGKPLYGHVLLGDAVKFPWNQVGPVLDHFGWSLPASAEFEWGLRGGVSSVYYRGDDFADFMADVNAGWQKKLGPERANARDSFDAIMRPGGSALRRRRGLEPGVPP